MSGLGEIADVNQYLGLEYNKWRNTVIALALQNPTEYFQEKNELEQKLKKNLISAIYKTIYSALNEGKDAAGNKIFINTNLRNIDPKYPIQKINEKSLDAAKAIEEIMIEIVDI